MEYKLNATMRGFSANVALADSAKDKTSPLWFRVYGNGRLLWESKLIDRKGTRDSCSVDITGVDKLELQVSCHGNWDTAHAVWLDPYVTDMPLAQVTKQVFLADLAEFDVFTGSWTLGKGNVGNNGARIGFGDVFFPKGLGMHPPSESYAHVSYRLNRKMGVFRSGVAIQSKGSRAPVTFQASSDGKVLWSSQPTNVGGKVQQCEVDVTGVDVLVLQVHCPGDSEGANAVWLDPHLMPKQGTATLSLEIDPEEADVYLDGALANFTASRKVITLEVSQGKHELKVEKPGYKVHTQTLDLTGITVKYVTVRLQPISSPPAAVGKCALTLEIDPDECDVYLDGKLANFTASRKVITIEVSPAKHELKVEKRGYKPYTQTVDLTGIALKRVQVKLEREAAKSPTTKVVFTALNIKDAATVASNRIFNQESLLFPAWGEHTYHDVPFTLVNPDGGKTKNAICLYSGRGAISARMPRTVRLGCDSVANRIHFLGAAGWGVPWTNKGSVSIVVKLHYADGEQEEHRLLNGVHFGDWALGPEVPGSKGIGVHKIRHFSIAPKRANDVIKSIEFHKGADQTSPFVMAVTTEAVVAAP